VGTTPKYGLPYPEPTTLITESAAIVKDLAEKIDTALSAVALSDTYTVPGTLLQTFTASGTFTPPAGITVVSVVVIGGGGTGTEGSMTGHPGGSGGGVRVFHDVPVSGPVAVTVGGSRTASSFGTLTAPGGFTAALDPIRGSGSPNLVHTADWMHRPSEGGPSGGGVGHNRAGYPGVLVNGTRYAGGGGGGYISTNGPAGNVLGGDGGGGRGQNPNGTGAADRQAQPGVNGLGGGSGGGYPTPPGGTGRVMVFAAQPAPARMGRATDEYAPAVPELVAALDDTGTVTGLYAVVTAGDGQANTVPYPAAPVPTGRTVTFPAGIMGPDAVTQPDTAWPTIGWTYTDNTWKEPTT